MSMTAEKMRKNDYYGHLHYYYVFDMELTANELRLLMIIQQMQSNPNPDIRPFFSYAWLAALLGIQRRQAIYIAKKLKDKGYLIHMQDSNGKWLWKIPTKPIHIQDEGVTNDDTNEPEEVQSECTPPVQSHCTPPVQSECTHKYNDLKANNINTASCLDGDKEPEQPQAKEASKQAFIISEELDRELLQLNRSCEMHAKDNREFLMWCKHNLDNGIKADSDEGKVRVLKSWMRKGGLKKPVTYGVVKSGDSSSSSDKPQNVGYGFTSASMVKKMDEKLETLAWDRVKNQKAPHEVLLAISKQASDVAKTHLKALPRAPGELVSEEAQMATLRYTVALAALCNGQASDISEFSGKISTYAGYHSPEYKPLIEMIEKEILKRGG